MSIDVLDRMALRALDPALVGGLSKSQRDAVTEAVMAVWQRFYGFRAYGSPCESAVYRRVPGE